MPARGRRVGDRPQHRHRPAGVDDAGVGAAARRPRGSPSPWRPALPSSVVTATRVGHLGRAPRTEQSRSAARGAGDGVDRVARRPSRAARPDQRRRAVAAADQQGRACRPAAAGTAGPAARRRRPCPPACARSARSSPGRAAATTTVTSPSPAPAIAIERRSSSADVSPADREGDELARARARSAISGAASVSST